MNALGEEVEALYRAGVDRSRLAQWIAAHEYVRGLVPAHPASAWAQGRPTLPLDGDVKEALDMILPDEFPLSVFFESLQREVRPVVDATKGIRG